MMQGFRDDMGGPRSMRAGSLSKVTAVSADSLTVTPLPVPTSAD